jgi:hypothetical protein
MPCAENIAQRIHPSGKYISTPYWTVQRIVQVSKGNAVLVQRITTQPQSAGTMGVESFHITRLA